MRSRWRSPRARWRIILYYATDGNDDTNGAYRITLGVTVRTENARNVYDADKGYGKVQEDVYLYTVEEGSLADSLGLNAGDKLVSIIVNGEEHAITRQYDISDLILTIRPNSTVQIRYERGGSETTTERNHRSVRHPPLLADGIAGAQK